MAGVLQDQRIFERFPSRFSVKFEHSCNDFGTTVFLRDASAQGVKIAVKEKVFKNDHLSLLVKLPDGFGPLLLHGKVVWTKEKSLNLWEAGIRFHEVDFMKMRRLFKYAESNPS